MFAFRPDRRILYLSSDRVAAYLSQGGNSLWPFLFDASGNGLAHFSRYLQQTHRAPTCLLVDVAQEEYRQDVIPHVSGSDRQALYLRKKQQYFRDTPYFHAALQGREKEGRRNDIVLYTALTSPDLVRPWVNLLFEHKTPFTGICSVSHLTAWLIDYLPGGTQQKLVISLQSNGGLRQTCYRDEKLKISRLIDLPFGTAATRASYINAETENMIRYLYTMGTLDSGNTLSIFYLADMPILESLREKISNSMHVQHHFIDVARLAVQIRLQDRIASPFCDQLFAHLLFERNPPNYYATRDELRYYRRHKARRFMHAASAALMLTGAGWGAVNFMEGMNYSRRTVSIKEQVEYYASMDRTVREKLPVTEMATADLKVLGDIAHNLRQQHSNPLSMLRFLGACMDEFPLIQVEKIEWSAGPQVGAAQNFAETIENATYNSTAPVTANGNQQYQIASLYGYVSPFNGDYRAALDLMHAFRSKLESSASVSEVIVLATPLDTGPEDSLDGSLLVAPGEARFSFRILLLEPESES